MSYEVIKAFRDKQTGKRLKPGDVFKTDDQNRIDLALQKGLIEAKSKQPPSVTDYHVGGGYYELPNGQKVKGKKEAEQALRGE